MKISCDDKLSAAGANAPVGFGPATKTFYHREIALNLDGKIQIEGEREQDDGDSSQPAQHRALIDRYLAVGESFLKKSRGGFRLALWDVQKETLIVAVDPFATKPIYYSVEGSVLSFASKLSFLTQEAQVAQEIDLNAIYFYLNHSFIPAPFTIYRNIRRLEPGQYLEWKKGKLEIRQYWDILYDEDRFLSPTSAADRVYSAVEDSVRFYLGVQSCCESELGAFLSGGTDSSTLVGFLSRAQSKPLKTFSVGFDEHPYNEIHYARIAASKFGVEAHECFVSADEALAALPVLAESFDEPFGNSSAIPTYFCLKTARESGVKVMFAGDGGDEIFAGNERYLGEKYFLPYDMLPAGLQVATKRIAAFLPGVSPLRKIRRYVERAAEPNPDRFFHYQLFLSGNAEEFFDGNFLAAVDRDSAVMVPRRHYERVGGVAPLNRLLYMDLKMCIADNDLFKVNRMAEASGIEVCFPYLDRNLAEMTGKIPAGLKLKGLKKRYIFKKAFAKLLPQEILRKKKHGFGLPSARWLRHHAGFRDMAHSLVLDRNSLHAAYFRGCALENLLKKHDQEKSDFYGAFIWNVMMLELWHRNHFPHFKKWSRGTDFAGKVAGIETG